MGDTMEVIKGRRSVRNYQDKEIPEDVLNELLEAIRWSPSWANTQCWEVVVVKDSLVKEQLQTTMSKGNPGTKSIVEAPVVLGVCGRLQSSGFYKGQQTTKFGDWFMFDLGLATQSLCLAAHHLGLGTVIVGLYDHDKAKERAMRGDRKIFPAYACFQRMTLFLYDKKIVPISLILEWLMKLHQIME